MTPWEIDALEIANCNCAIGCPCQFDSLPTYGNCEAAVGFIIRTGHHGDVKLDGVKAAAVAHWPGPIHEGNGSIQLIVDSSASLEQCRAIETIFSGGDTEDMATVFWVFDKMAPNKLETLTKPIDLAVDMDARSAIPSRAKSIGLASIFLMDSNIELRRWQAEPRPHQAQSRLKTTRGPMRIYAGSI
jgi:hypothetical protein